MNDDDEKGRNDSNDDDESVKSKNLLASSSEEDGQPNSGSSSDDDNDEEWRPKDQKKQRGSRSSRENSEGDDDGHEMLNTADSPSLPPTSNKRKMTKKQKPKNQNKDVVGGISRRQKRRRSIDKRLENLRVDKNGKRRDKNSTTSSSSAVDIDWNRLADNNSELALQPLFEGLDTNQISSLIGLATTLGQENDQKEDAVEEPISSNNNPLHVLDNPDQRPPLRHSFLNYIIHRATAIQTQQRQQDDDDDDDDDNDCCIEELFDTSALVAMGWILENMITASLLPYSDLHVLRCRQLDDNNSNGQQKDHEDIVTIPKPLEENKKILTGPICRQQINSDQLVSSNANQKKPSSSFDEWTLPPEEAMMKLLQQNYIVPSSSSSEGDNNISGCMSLLQEPSRSFVAGINNPISTIPIAGSRTKRKQRPQEQEQYEQYSSKQKYPIGTKVIKTFAGDDEPSKGEVIDYEEDDDFYRIRYDPDGDEEELNESELKSIIVVDDENDRVLSPPRTSSGGDTTNATTVVNAERTQQHRRHVKAISNAICLDPYVANHNKELLPLFLPTPPK